MKKGVYEIVSGIRKAKEEVALIRRGIERCNWQGRKAVVMATVYSAQEQNEKVKNCIDCTTK